MTIRRLLFTLLLAASAASMSANGGATAPDNKGTDFFLAFPQNVSSTPLAGHRMTLFLAAEEAATVEISGPMVVTRTVDIPASSVLEVFLDLTALQVSPDGVSNKGIRVRSIDPSDSTKEGAPIAVYGLNRRPPAGPVASSAGAYTALPVDVLGTQYRALTRLGTATAGSQVTIVGTRDNTTVTVTPVTTPMSGVTTVGTPFQVTVGQLQTYLLQDPADLTGTLVTSDKPIAVFSGNQNNGVNGGSTDHMVEQLVPINAWGNEFVIAPIEPASSADVVRVLAHEDDTQILDVNGEALVTLAAGTFHEFIQAPAAGSWIRTSKPVLVAHYNKGDAFTTDVFVMLVPPVSQFSRDYRFNTPIFPRPPLLPFTYSDRVNIVVKDGDHAGLWLDGAPLSTTWTSVNGYRYARVPVSPGASHRLEHQEPAVRFGAWLYGQANGEAYGTAAGQLVEDETPPTIHPLPANQTVEATGPDGAAVTWDDPTATDFGRGEIDADCSPSSGSVFPLGTTWVTCRAIDPAGNEAADRFSVTVEDKTPPTLTLPDNISLRPTSRHGAIVTFEATATDLVDPSVSVVCDPPSGRPFAPGSKTDVTCTATDMSGNSSGGSFTVSVINGAPICSAAVPSAPQLWPANHDLVPITIRDVTDPDGDHVSIHIDSVFQDEPINGARDGNSVVDGFGIAHIAMVRAERNARGDGRVYHIGFTAFDEYGASCPGTVTVGVPRLPNLPAVDHGAIYDSSAQLPTWAAERLHRLIRRMLSMR